MARFIPCACLFVICFAVHQQHASGIPIIAAKKVIDMAFDLYKDIKMVQEYFQAPETGDAKISMGDTKILNKLDDLSEDIDKLRNDIIGKISDDLRSKIGVKTDKLFDLVHDGERLFKKFMTFVNNASELQESTLDDFSKTVTSNSLCELSTTIERMHEALIGVDAIEENILSILSDNKNPQLMCIRSKSPQYIINELYHLVIITDIKTLAVKLFGYEHKEARDNVKYTFERNLLMQEFKERSNKTYHEVLKHMAIASRELWKCDPEVHVKGKTYTKLQEVFQATVSFERDMDELCSQECSAIKDSGTTCKSNMCQTDKKCIGRLRNCDVLDRKKTFCRSPASSDRKFDWMISSNGKHYGHVEENCKDKVIREWEYPEWSFWQTCDFCICTCDSHLPYIDRFFSLRSSYADIFSNKVVTGARLVTVDHIIHIQIQHGVLGPRGSIDPTTVEWRNLSDANLMPSLFNHSTELFSKRPYFAYAVNWDQKRVYLDDIEDKNSRNKFLTGLRFARIDGEDDLRFEAELTEFDFETGQLVDQSNRFNINDARRKQRSELVLRRADNPLRLKNHLKDSRSGQYVEFQITDLEKDFGQMTVPFIDTQPIVSNPPAPFSGAGLFHKGTKDSGGFLALKLIQFDFTKHLEQLNP